MKIYVIIIVLLCSMVTSVIVLQQCDAYDTVGEQIARKCTSGMLNIFAAPFDMLNYVEDVRFKGGILQALTYGMFKGVSGAVVRATYGLYEVSTCYCTEFELPPFEPGYDAAVIRVVN